MYKTVAMKYGLKHEEEAAKTYMSHFSLKISRVGIDINLSCPYLGCSPDRMVYDNSEDDRFGLLEIKCPMKASFTECDYLMCVGDVYTLKTTTSPRLWGTAYYWLEVV